MHDAQMLPQGMRRTEILATEVTLVVTHARMLEHMPFQFLLIDEFLVTYGTRPGFALVVLAIDVLIQSFLRIETKRAQ